MPLDCTKPRRRTGYMESPGCPVLPTGRFTRLRGLKCAKPSEQAKAVLKQFLPRFNRRFQVPAQCPDPAFRPLPPDLHLGQVLCFKHKRKVARDNTVKFQRHTLQLLPDRQRRSYTGAAVVVLHGLDGRLSLQHEGRIIAAQEAPPSPGSLRNGIKPSSGDASQSPDPKGLSQPRETAPEPLTMVAAANGHGSVIDDADVVSMTVTSSPRRPSFCNRPAGTRCRRPSSRACPFARWPESWASTETP